MKKTKISNETKVGIFSVIAIVLMYLGFNFMKGKDIFGRQSDYYAIYTDIKNMPKSSEVVFRGHKVGIVNDIFLGENNQIVVGITVSNRLQIPKGATAFITTSDLIGTKIVEISFPEDAKISAYHESGDTLRSEIKMGLTDKIEAELKPISEKVNRLVVSLDTITQSLNAILASNQIQNTLASLNNTMATIDKMVNSETAKIQNITSSLQKFATTLAKNSDKLESIITNLDETTTVLANGDLDKTLENLNKTTASLNLVMQKIENGDGTAGMLLNDKKLYENLEKSAADLDALLVDLKANPKRYVRFSVFGGKGDKPDKSQKE